MLAHCVFDKQHHTLWCENDWTIVCLQDIEACFIGQDLPESQQVTIDGSKITHLDSAGALALRRCITALEHRNNTVSFQAFNSHHADMLALLHDHIGVMEYLPPSEKKHGFLYRLGKEVMHKYHQVKGIIDLIGDLTVKFTVACRQRKRFHLPNILSNIQSTGITALPIVGLLSLLIGIVLAYQMGLQLEMYGANSFIAYLSGMAVFREFGPLITAIIVAGRTSSAFTAQIGSMQLNEEIDALYCMGLSPTELLVLPKVIGLSVFFPLLIFWADAFGILGAMLMSKWMLHISYLDFLVRLRDSVGLDQLRLGLYKAPAFSLLIAIVGCFQGFRVEMSADSVGRQTTKSVVQALFLIIITDAVYSVIYSWLNL